MTKEPSATLGAWHEDGTGREQVDGTPTTGDVEYNRGYDAGYCAGLLAGAPPARSPRWDEDLAVLRAGFLRGRCGNCGEPYSGPPLRSAGS